MNEAVIISGIVFGVIQLIIAGVTVWFVSKRTPLQNITDDSTASVNFRNIVVSLQAVVKEQDTKINELEDKLNRAHLEVTLSIEIGKRPEVESYKWVEKEVKPVIMAS